MRVEQQYVNYVKENLDFFWIQFCADESFSFLIVFISSCGNNLDAREELFAEAPILPEHEYETVGQESIDSYGYVVMKDYTDQNAASVDQQSEAIRENALMALFALQALL